MIAESDQPSLQCTVHQVDDTNKLFLSVQPLDEGPSPTRTPVDIVCVLDTSGSMSSKATVQNEQGEVESHGLSLLDVVVHAARTIVALLGPQDRLSIVTFSSKCKTVFAPTLMTPEAQAAANKALDTVRFGGTTKMLGAILHGLDAMDSLPDKQGRLQSLFLFTDGMPDESESQFHNDLTHRKHGISCTIEAFGFGYNMNSKLLEHIATIGGGHYNFIPDSGMVGTVFVNSLSNLLVAKATKCTLRIGQSQEMSDEDYTIDLPTMFRQQPFTYTVDASVLSSTPPLFYSLSYHDVDHGSCKVEGSVTRGEAPPQLCHLASTVSLTPQQLILRGELHTAFIQGIDECIKAGHSGNQEQAEQLLDSLQTRFETGSDSLFQDKLWSGTAEELRDQVSKALLNPTWFKKWGRHYLPSLRGAHFGHCCNNFKDPGLQSFGGELFQRIRDEADDKFVSLPAPKPSSGDQSTRSEPVDMSRYHCAYGGCFTADSMVLMADGRTKRVDQIVSGDEVMTADAVHTATVQVVVEIVAIHGKMDIVTLNQGLKLTPFHPVVHRGEWVFPCSLVNPVTVVCDRVFDFVLDSHHSMVIGGVTCVTLAHGKSDNNVVAHEFFGTSRVRDALSLYPGYQRGRVTVPSSAFVRSNGQSSRIDSLINITTPAETCSEQAASTLAIACAETPALDVNIRQTVQPIASR
jgi:Mg-chelatase subunit ChlD